MIDFLSAKVKQKPQGEVALRLIVLLLCGSIIRHKREKIRIVF